MLVFSAIASHLPLLVPQIGKDSAALLGPTLQAYDKLAQILIETKVKTLIIISPHGSAAPNTFSFNIAPEFVLEFSEFGNLVDKKNLSGDLILGQELKNSLTDFDNLQLLSEPQLDAGAAVPAWLLSANSAFKILPLYYDPEQSLVDCYEFGAALGNAACSNANAIGILASADLSQKLSRRSPAGYSPFGKKFDQKVLQALQQNQIATLLQITDAERQKAAEGGLSGIMIWCGVKVGLNWQTKLLSYDTAFGIGCPVLLSQ